MVAFSDVSSAVPIRRQQARGRKGMRGGSALGGLARLLGVALLLAAAGIWMTAAPLWDGAMMLMRLAVSMLFLCTGLVLLQVARQRSTDEVHLDRRAGVLRHIRRGRDGIARVQRSIALAELDEITVADDHLILTAHDGAVLLELSGLARDELQLIQRAMRKL
jgi:hypothetical protein